MPLILVWALLAYRENNFPDFDSEGCSLFLKGNLRVLKFLLGLAGQEKISPNPRVTKAQKHPNYLGNWYLQVP